MPPESWRLTRGVIEMTYLVVILSFIKGKNKNILLFICYHLKEYE